MPLDRGQLGGPGRGAIDAILFGGRRATNVPLVTESLSWQHGVFMGATVSSEQTAAAEGTVGALRRDPFAMLPFCGYNMADYWGHWLSVGKATSPDKLPRVFQVNWFRKDASGRFIWPGFGENSRVIEWVANRVSGHADAVDNALGRAPAPGALNVDGLEVSEADLAELFAVHTDSWLAEADLTAEYFEQFGDAVPAELYAELDALRARLTTATG